MISASLLFPSSCSLLYLKVGDIFMGVVYAELQRARSSSSTGKQDISVNPQLNLARALPFSSICTVGLPSARSQCPNDQLLGISGSLEKPIICLMAKKKSTLAFITYRLDSQISSHLSSESSGEHNRRATNLSRVTDYSSPHLPLITLC